MSGRDVPTRQKTLSVAFSVIMVLSMVAMGMAAGFAGSATAQLGDSTADIQANPANTTVDNSGTIDHVATINVTDTIAGDDVADSTITLDYDVGDIGVVGSTAFDSNADVTVEIIRDGNVVVSDGTNSGDFFNGGSDGDVTTNADNNNIVIDAGADVGSASYQAGDTIRVVLPDPGGNEGFDQSSVGDSSVDITVDSTRNSYTANTDAGPFDSNAPVTVDDGAVAQGVEYTSFQQAIADVNGDTSAVTVSGDVDEFLSQPAAVEDGVTTAQIPDAASGVTIQGDGDQYTITFINQDDSNGGTAIGNAIDVQSNNDITVDNLHLNSSDVIDGHIATAITAGTADNLVITNSKITDFTEESAGEGVVSLGDGDDPVINKTTFDGDTAENYNAIDVDGAVSGNGIDIDENTINNASQGIQIDALADSQSVNISSNRIELEADDSDEALDIDIGNNNDAQAVIENNTITSTVTDSGTAYVLAASGGDSDATIDISGGSVDNVTTAVDAETNNVRGAYLNVTNVTMTNIGTGQGVTVNDGHGDLGILEVSGVSIEGDGSNTVGVRVLTNLVDEVDVLDSSINNTDVGVNIGEAGSFANVSNTDITNSNSKAIDLDGATSDANIDSGTLIDQAPTGVEIDASGGANIITLDNIEVNGTTNTGAADGGAGVFVESLGNADDVVSITDSTFTNNEEALNISADAVSADTEEVNVHFNTFENNVYGVGVGDLDVEDDDPADNVINVTFNDFVDNTEGLNVTSQTGADTVNANYSWWGSDAGPNSDLGDSVTAAAGDATTEPYLLESAVDNYDDSNLGGMNVLRFGHNVEVTNNKGAVSFPTTANRTAGASIEGNTTDVMVYKLVDGQFIDAGDQVPDTMEGHVIDLTESSRTSAWVTISYSDDVQDGLGGVTYEQGQNLVGPPTQGAANATTVFGLSGDYVIRPFLSNTDDKFEPNSPLDKSKSDSVDDEVSPFDAYIIEVPDADDDLVDRFRGGNIPGGTDASEVEALLTN